MIEDLGFPDPFMWLLEAVIPNKNRLINTLGVLKNYILGSFGVGQGSTRIEVELERIFEGGHTSSFLPYLGMGTEATDGSLRLTKNGNIEIDWNHRNSKQMFREMEAALKALSAGLKGRYKSSLLWRWPTRKLLTAHPLGGCAMSMSPQAGVVNEFGEVWEYPNLYVADGAIIPTALAVNPSATIGALAERIAFWLIHGREMQANDLQLGRTKNNMPESKICHFFCLLIRPRASSYSIGRLSILPSSQKYKIYLRHFSSAIYVNVFLANYTLYFSGLYNQPN